MILNIKLCLCVLESSFQFYHTCTVYFKIETIFLNTFFRLIQKNYDVICYMADIGQNEDFEKAKQKAKSIGAKDVSICTF